MNSSQSISIIMPAYNEEERIEVALEEAIKVLEQLKIKYEIIVVNDGSTDGTLEKVLQFAKNHDNIKVVSYSNNKGKGYGIKAGFAHVKNDLVFFIDADGEISLRNISSYVHALEHSDVVIASKWHPQSKVKIPVMRKILSRGFYLIAKLLTGIRVSDTQTGYKAFKREALEKILKMQLVKRYSFDVELLVLASLLKLKIVELPVTVQLSASFSLREVWRMLIELLGITYRLRVKRWYQKNLALNPNSIAK